MTDRTDRIPLTTTEPRCEPAAKHCSVRAQCARGMATVPQGTPMRDYTQGDYMANVFGGTAHCPGLLPIDQVRAAAAQPVTSRPAKPWPGSAA